MATSKKRKKSVSPVNSAKKKKLSLSANTTEIIEIPEENKNKKKKSKVKQTTHNTLSQSETELADIAKEIYQR